MNIDLTDLDVKAGESLFTAYMMFDISEGEETYFHAAALNAYDCVHMMSSCLLWRKKNEVVGSGLGHHKDLIKQVNKYLKKEHKGECSKYYSYVNHLRKMRNKIFYNNKNISKNDAFLILNKMEYVYNYIRGIL